ncbi:MAG TPA: protein kinase [Kofleriaceae bacterium]
MPDEPDDGATQAAPLQATQAAPSQAVPSQATQAAPSQGFGGPPSFPPPLPPTPFGVPPSAELATMAAPSQAQDVAASQVQDVAASQAQDVAASQSTMAAPSQGFAGDFGLPPMASLAPPPLASLAPPTLGGPPEMPEEPVARYILDVEIARGGMGRVVEAMDTTLGRIVAFKEALTTDSDSLKRFAREVRITARLEHPAIVPVHDAGVSPSGAPFYVMRKIGGRPLERLVAMAASLEERLALVPHIVASAQAIAHAHERGIVHRDIKPSNILVGELGETIVIDWGLAKVIGEPDEHDPTVKPLVDLSDSLKTRVGIVYGTPGFMAPEQLRGAPVDEKCDVYALGATLYHLLARKPPHHAKTADEMMKAAVAAPPTPVRELVTGVPPELATIVDKALAHDPRTRYQNAKALAEDLQRFLTGQLIASHHYTAREKLVRFLRKHRQTVLALGGAAVVLLVLGIFAIRRIVVERDRADAEAHHATDEAKAADAARRVSEQRADQLLISEARTLAATEPTRAVALVKPLAQRDWRDVRAIAATAKAHGIAWSLPAPAEPVAFFALEGGRGAIAAGTDGALWRYDLPAHQATLLATIPGLAGALEVNGSIAAWHGRSLDIYPLGGGRSLAGGAPRTVTTDQPITAATANASKLYWTDASHAVWSLDLDLTDAIPAALPAAGKATLLAVSPGGHWLALGNEDGVSVLDLVTPGATPASLVERPCVALDWSANGVYLAALVGADDDHIAYDFPIDGSGGGALFRDAVGASTKIALGIDGIYTIGPSGVRTVTRTAKSRARLAGSVPIGFATARGDVLLAADNGGIVALAGDGDVRLELKDASIKAIAASRDAPYVLALTEGRLLVWNLDDVQPRPLTHDPPSGAELAGSQLFLSFDGAPTLLRDLASDRRRELPAWPPLRMVVATPGAAIVVDSGHRAHLMMPTGAPIDLEGDTDLAVLATPTTALLARDDGTLDALDFTTRARKTLVAHTSHLIGIAAGRGTHSWVAAAFVDGTLWRKDLASGTEQTIARQPALAIDDLAERDGQLVVLADGTVAYLAGMEVRAWTPPTEGSPAGVIVTWVTLPSMLANLGVADDETVIAFSESGTAYAFPRSDPAAYVTQQLGGAMHASMATGAGLVTAIDHASVTVYDPILRAAWVVATPPPAPPDGGPRMNALDEPLPPVSFSSPQLSSDGRWLVAHTPEGLVGWDLGTPIGPEATAKWLDSLTNATVTPDAARLVWK